MITFHKHRIVPGHMGGTYEASNVIRVNVAMHAFLHQQLWKEHGRWQDKLAWRVLARMISTDQARSIAVSEMNKERWANDPAYRAKMKKIHQTPRESASADMKAQWAKHSFRSGVANGQKKRWADPEQRRRVSERMKHQKYGLGYKHTPEELAKISAASKAQWAARTPEQKAAMIAARVASRLRNKVRH